MPLNQVTVTIDNAAPQAGTNLTPLWVGFHNGEFDTYDRARPVSPGLESIAEDGDTALFSQEFALSGLGDVDGTIGSAPIAPGSSVRQTFNVDASEGRYFNYASMVLPSNDTFIANGNPLVHEIFDEAGNFIGADILVSGAQALDAGTEVNDELPANTAFFGQQTPNTGVDENGVVQLSSGFNPVGSGGILDDPRFANADFTAEGYQIARIRVSANPSARLAAVLDAAQEPDGGGDPNASGTSEFILNEFGDALSYSLTVSGLDFGQFVGDGTAQTEDTSDDVTRIHLHNAERGVNGGVAFGLIDQVLPAADGQDNDDLTITQNADGSTTLQGIWETTDPALVSLTEFVESINNAEPGADIPLYWNIHTNGSPGGAIRGQLQGAEDAIAPNPTPDTNFIVGAPGDNSALFGDENANFVIGLAGDSELFGLGGDDTLQGDLDEPGGNDTLFGGVGADLLIGEAGDDVLFGEADDDVLIGGSGSDFLRGGSGTDTLIGGEGADIFALAAGEGTSIITDFEVGADFIGLAEGLTFGQLYQVQEGANTVVGTIAGEVLAVLVGAEASQINEGVFLSV